MKVDKDTVLGEIVKHKGGEEILHKHHVPCVTCPMAAMEMGVLKVGDVCKMYGIDEKKLIEDLKKLK